MVIIEHMNQWMIVLIFLAFIMGYKYCSNELKNPFMVAFALCIVYFVYIKYKPHVKEGFDMQNDSRTLRYGDIITIWSPSVNKFLQADPTAGNKMGKTPFGKINLSNSLISSEDIPSSMDWVQFMIIDAKDPGDIGNTGPVTYGSSVYLRTMTLQDGKFIPTYVSPNRDNSVYMSSERYDGDANKAEQQLVLESATGLQDSNINYGDMIFIKTWRTDMNYIHVSRGNDVILSNSNAITRTFYLTDRFGQGRNIDWARRGSTRQSTTNNNLYSQFAIDGNMLTYSSTSKEQKPWWEVSLPKDVLVSRIVISSLSDTNQSGLDKFNIKLIDFDNTLVDVRRYDGNRQEKYRWEDINQIGRKIRIELDKTDQLNIADVRVYGQAVNYSLLLNEEMSKNLISNKTFDHKSNISFKHRTLPRVRRDMTVMFLLELDKLPTEVSNIMIKSNNIEENRTPNLLIYPPKRNSQFSTLQYIVSTEAGNNEMGENFLINYNVLPNKKFHVTAVHNAGVNKENDWMPCRFLSKDQPGEYVCNFTTREMYKIVLSDSEEFKKEKVIELDDPKNYGFRLRGLYSDDLSIAAIQIYINGLLNTTYLLRSIIRQNSDSLTIGAFKKYPGFDGDMSFLKYSNRVIPEEYIQKESQILTGRLTIQVIAAPTTVGTQNILKIDPNVLPDISSKKPEYTLQLWINSQRPITGTGNDEAIVQYGQEGIFFYSDKNTIYTKTNMGDLGIEQGNYNVPVDQWIHIAYVIKEENLSLYVNGKKTASKALGKKDVKNNSFAMIKLGGYNGMVGNVQFSNYGLTEAEIKNSLSSNPVKDSMDKVRDSFKKAGCTTDPIDPINPYVDNYNSSWITFATKNEDAKLTQSIGDFKKLADEGIQTEDVIKLRLAEKCYGKEDAATRVELNRNKKMLKDVETQKDSIKCLPKAPFTCKKYNIDDFDIRTHKEFQKYIEKSKIREAPKPFDRVTQMPPDPTKYLSKEFVEDNFVEKANIEKSQDFVNMKSKLDEMTKQIQEMNKLKDLVDKCQANNDKLAKTDKYISDLKKISETDPSNKALATQLTKLDVEMALTNKTANKDSQKLLNKLSLTDMTSRKAELDKEFDFLQKDKKNNNLELQKLQQRMSSGKGKCDSNFSLSGFNNTSRNQMSQPLSKMSVKSDQWLEKQVLDLDKIDKMVKQDLKEIESKLDKINHKMNSKKMNEFEMANITNHISSIKQNQLGK